MPLFQHIIQTVRQNQMGSSGKCTLKAQKNLCSMVTEDLQLILFQFYVYAFLPNYLVKATVFPVVMYACESWTMKKAECGRIDAFELWCWRRLLRVPWTAWSGQPIRSPADLPDPEIELGSPALQLDSLPTEVSEKPNFIYKGVFKICILE